MKENPTIIKCWTTDVTGTSLAEKATTIKNNNSSCSELFKRRCDAYFRVMEIIKGLNSMSMGQDCMLISNDMLQIQL